MPRSGEQHIGKELAKLNAQVKKLQKGGLQNSSLHGGGLPFYDDDDVLRSVYGPYGFSARDSGPQPTPTAPIMGDFSNLGTGEATWDGETTDFPVTAGHGHTEVLIAFSEGGSEPHPDEYHLASMIMPRVGGTTTIVCPAGGTWYVVLRIVGADQVTKGDMSDPTTVEVEALVDTEQIRADLDEARERLEAAAAEAAEAKQRVEDLQEEWETERFPALQEAIGQAVEDLAAAEVRVGQALTAAQNAQAAADRLRDEDLPQLQDALDANAAAITQAQSRLDEAESRVAAAESDLEVIRDERLPQAEDRISDSEAGLDDLRENRLPELAQNLTVGLSDVYAQAEARAQQLANGAVAQAASNAQSEYDRLQEIAERALARAGDNLVEDPSFETSYWVDAWNGVGGRVARHTNNPRTGARAVLIEGGASVTNFPFPDVDVELGQSYRLSVWYRTWPSSLADLSDEQSALVIYDSDTGAELAVSEPLTQGSEYRRADVMLTVEGGASSIRPVIRVSHTSGFLLFDDVSFREVGAAAEALRIAELARLAAEAAHLEAGSAQNLAAQAYDSASTKNAIHWSLSAPSGTGADGDTWWRYETVGGSSRRRVIAQWHWDNGVWVQDELGAQIIAQVDAGVITFGEMHGDRIAANTIKVRHLQISSDENLWRGETDMANRDLSQATWLVDSGGFSAWSYISDMAQGHAFHALRVNNPTGYHRIIHRGSRIRAVAGEQYHYQQWARIDSGGFSTTTWSQVGAQFVWLAQDGSVISSATHSADTSSSGNKLITASPTPPAGAYWLEIRFVVSATGNGAARLWPPLFRKKVGSVVISDGAVRANHIIAEEIAAAVAQFLQLHAGQITAGTIDAARLNVTDLAARIASVIQLNASRITAGTIDTARLNVSQLAVEIASVISLNASRITAGTINTSRLNVQQLAGAIAEFLTVRAENIEADAVGVRELNAESIAANNATMQILTAGVARFLEVSAEMIDVASLFADTAFVLNFRASVVEALQVTAVSGFIGGALLEDSTITVEKLYALDEIMSELGRFLRIEVDQLASNDIVGMIIRGGRIEGVLGVLGELQVGDRFTDGPGQGGVAIRTGSDEHGTILGWDFSGLASLRLGGRNNYLAGELYAKTAANSGTQLSSGDVTYREGYNTGSSWGLTYRNRTSTGPYLKFLRDGIAANNSPTFVWDEVTGEFVIVPAQTGSNGDSMVSIPSTLKVERAQVEGNTRMMGNAQLFGTIGTYNSITLAGTYTHNRPCFYRQFGNIVVLGGAVNSHAQNRFGGSIAQLPAPSSIRQLTTARTNSAGGHETMPVQIATNGWMTVPGGAQIESGTPMSLDGLMYLTG